MGPSREPMAVLTNFSKEPASVDKTDAVKPSSEKRRYATTRAYKSHTVKPCEGQYEPLVKPNPVVIDRSFPRTAYFNIDAIPFKNLLAPEFYLGESLGGMTREYCDQYRYHFIHRLKKRIAESDANHPDSPVSKEDKDKLIRLAHFTMDNRTSMKGLSKIGHELRALYETKYQSPPPELPLDTGEFSPLHLNQLRKTASVSVTTTEETPSLTSKPEAGEGFEKSIDPTLIEPRHVAMFYLAPDQYIKYPLRPNKKPPVPEGKLRELLNTYLEEKLKARLLMDSGELSKQHSQKTG
ncbi:hypothetical protein [Endozoicomonas arenosclerae]|uniref:hypothetical protein n=1 Tax=Endozoicomonas arenosclerae TaxID=1633495 RepID=UPI000B2F3AD1|nr:hypothetical protein [Endozoicomonas arenosclerae]